MPENPIYDYLKKEGITDLSEKDFITKYSDRTKLKDVYKYLRDNKNTDLGFEDFSNKYFPLPKLNGASSQGSKQIALLNKQLATLKLEQAHIKRKLIENECINRYTINFFFACCLAIFLGRYLFYAVSWSIKTLKT